MTRGFYPPRAARPTPVLYAVRALEIDNTLAETHALLAQYHKRLRAAYELCLDTPSTSETSSESYAFFASSARTRGSQACC